MIKHKGQIVPKYLIRSIEKKAQHLVKFGCDCEIINDKVYPIADGNVFVIPSTSHVRVKKGKRKVKGFDCGHAKIDSRKYGTINTCFYIESPINQFKLKQIDFNIGPKPEFCITT